MTKFIEAIGMGGGLLIVFVLLILASGLAIIWYGDALGKFAYLVPIVFLFIAIGAFLLLLEHYAYTLHEMRPELPFAALGLPEGSIRAFLTIGLLTLVAVFGTFLYFESGSVSYVVVRGHVPVTSTEQLEQLRNEVGARFVVIPRYKDDSLVEADIVTATPDTSRSDIAKQLLTMITTVLTTVIGFYFGTGSAGTSVRPGGSTITEKRQSDEQNSGSTDKEAKATGSGSESPKDSANPAASLRPTATLQENSGGRPTG
jgi:hypothetical protein